jgi:hypothetical protein
MPKAIMRPLQEFCAQPSSIKRFSVRDRADPAASLKLRHQFQPRLKVWPHYDVPPLTAFCFDRNNSSGIELYFGPLDLFNF